MYVEAEFYTTIYGGSIIPEEKWQAYEARASIFVDKITFKRLRDFPPEEKYWQAIRFGICDIAEKMFIIDGYAGSAAVSAGDSASAASRSGRISSVSSGDESISYGSAGTEAYSEYAKMASDEDKKNSFLYSIAENYLGNIPDENGTNLLFAGVW